MNKKSELKDIKKTQKTSALKRNQIKITKCIPFNIKGKHIV